LPDGLEVRAEPSSVRAMVCAPQRAEPRLPAGASHPGWVAAHGVRDGDHVECRDRAGDGITWSRRWRRWPRRDAGGGGASSTSARPSWRGPW